MDVACGVMQQSTEFKGLEFTLLLQPTCGAPLYSRASPVSADQQLQMDFWVCLALPQPMSSTPASTQEWTGDDPPWQQAVIDFPRGSSKKKKP